MDTHTETKQPPTRRVILDKQETCAGAGCGITLCKGQEGVVFVAPQEEPQYFCHEGHLSNWYD